jgi:hypothetical protein
MTKPQRPPMFGPTAWIDLEIWKPGPGKCRLTSDIVASLMKVDVKTLLDNCTTRLPMNSTKGDSTEPALEQAELALVSRGD